MGDYLKLKNGKRIKIGTCGDCYYLRFDQIRKLNKEGIKWILDNLKYLTFRIPLLDEWKIKPGEFDFFNETSEKNIRVRYKYTYKEIELPTGRKTEIKEKTKGAQELYNIIQNKNAGYIYFWDRIQGIGTEIKCRHGHYENYEKDGMRLNGFNENCLGITGVAIRNNNPAAIIGCLSCGDTIASIGLEEMKETITCRGILTKEKIQYKYLIDYMKEMKKELIELKKMIN